MKGYRQYFLKKIGWFIITFIFAFILNFILPRLMPGDPVAAIVARMAQGMTNTSGIQKIYEQYTQLFGTNRPMIEQFFIYVRNVFSGNFGFSFSAYPRSVADVLQASVWWTVCLQFPAIIVGWIIGNTLGALAAYLKKGFDKVLMPASIFVSNFPPFGMAVILMVVFALRLNWFPSSGGYGFDLIPTFSWQFIWSVFVHYQLPFWSIVIIAIGGQAIGMRSMSIYELNADYVKYARFMGIKDRKIVGYVFRNAMLPQVTGLALSIGTMVFGALVAEIIFSYPGLGFTLLNAVMGGDYPLISATTLIITVMVLIATFAIEIVYGFIDPRHQSGTIGLGGDTAMKNTLQQVFRSGKFMVGFVIFMALLLTVFIYPLFIKDAPLSIIARGTFFPPGIYVNTFDTVNAPTTYTLMLDDEVANRIASKLGDQERKDIQEWLVLSGIPESQIDINNTKTLIDLWDKNYDPKKSFPGMTYARQRYFQRLNTSLEGILSIEGEILAVQNAQTGALDQVGAVNQSDYVNVGQVANVRVLPLGTDNFGRDVLTELVKAIGVSLQIGLIAGTIATLIGLTLGLVSGYIGGWVDDLIMFVTNLFIVIPGFVLLILISFSVGQEKRGATMIAVVIGLTSWVWTTRAVRSQVISLRNRDHVNLSKISGHSVTHIIIHDILPYIASYVVMAFILQISSAILAEASLSIIGLGPRTSEVPTLGLMMNWAMIYQAHILGKWWAYFPVIVAIALITFSMNLMNTGLDQVFNPALRD